MSKLESSVPTCSLDGEISSLQPSRHEALLTRLCQFQLRQLLLGRYPARPQDVHIINVVLFGSRLLKQIMTRILASDTIGYHSRYATARCKRLVHPRNSREWRAHPVRFHGLSCSYDRDIEFGRITQKVEFTLRQHTSLFHA